MKKRMLAMVFACFMAMSLTACGGSNNAASSTTESTTQAQTDTTGEDTAASNTATPEYYFKDNELVATDVKITLRIGRSFRSVKRATSTATLLCWRSGMIPPISPATKM